jgi:hypothetical protein
MRLYEIHKEHEINLMKKQQEKLENELKECSFQPYRITKSKDRKFLPTEKSIERIE